MIDRVSQPVPYPYDPDEALRVLRESVVKYHMPTEPVGSDDWEAGS